MPKYESCKLENEFTCCEEHCNTEKKCKPRNDGNNSRCKKPNRRCRSEKNNTPCRDGKDGKCGRDGENGKDGKDGEDGEDGSIPFRYISVTALIGNVTLNLLTLHLYGC